MDKTNSRKTGSLYEEKAAGYLQEQGFQIIARNFRCKIGEIDIIAFDKNCLCFIEVKFRKNDSCGRPAAAVTYAKQRTIIRVSEYFIMKRNMYDFMRRYDVIEITGNNIALLKNAFGG